MLLCQNQSLRERPFFPSEWTLLCPYPNKPEIFLNHRHGADLRSENLLFFAEDDTKCRKKALYPPPPKKKNLVLGYNSKVAFYVALEVKLQAKGKI